MVSLCCFLKISLLILWTDVSYNILQIEALKAVGVIEVVLAINYQPEVCEVFPCVGCVKLKQWS